MFSFAGTSSQDGDIMARELRRFRKQHIRGLERIPYQVTSVPQRETGKRSRKTMEKYDVEFVLPAHHGYQNLKLRISLKSDFPKSKPILQIMIQCTHPWISTDGFCKIIGHYGLNHWNQDGNQYGIYHPTSLGDVVKEIIEKFKNDPPKVLSEQESFQAQQRARTKSQSQKSKSRTSGTYSNSSPHVSPPNYDYATSQRSSHQPNHKVHHNDKKKDSSIKHNKGKFANIKVPSPPSSFDSLNDLSLVHLRLMTEQNGKNDAFQSLLETHQHVMKDMLKDLAIKNDAVAKENINLETGIREKQARNKETFKELLQLQRDLKALTERKENVLYRFSPSVVRSRLENAVMEADDERMLIEANFVDGKIKMEKFIQIYNDASKKRYLHQAKLDALRI